VADFLRRYPPGRKLGNGAYKWVYASGEFAIAFSRHVSQMNCEIKCLKHLKKIGIPATDVIEYVRFKRTERFNSLCAAMVMPRYRHISKVTPSIRKRCVEIDRILRKKRLYIADAQVMVGPCGVVIVDPFDISVCKERRHQTFWFLLPTTSGGYNDKQGGYVDGTGRWVLRR